MKKLFALVTLVTGFVSGSLLAQDFSGTITWTMRVEVTDPALKQQMAESQAQLANPQMQADMKAAQESMNSPEMQEMMKANPQMRAMLEKQMKMPAAGGAGADPFPKGFTLKIKGPRSLVRTEGGFGARDVLTWADKNVAYEIDREARTYRKTPAAPAKDTAGKFKVTPTKETAKVLGYTCRNYLVETTDSEMKMNYSIWATNDIKGLDARSLRRLRMGQSAGADFLAQIEGMPLKIDATTPQAKLFMLATSVKAESLPDSVFALPEGFTEVAN